LDGGLYRSPYPDKVTNLLQKLIAYDGGPASAPSSVTSFTWISGIAALLSLEEIRLL
jgi:hypothetical protein